MSGELSPEAWQALMEALDADPDKAADQYLDLQDRLVRFFEWRQASLPEELAFETLKRVAVRFSRGVELKVTIKSFALGFARLVLQEHWRDPVETELDTRTLDQKVVEEELDDSHLKERLARCLEACAEGDPEAYDLLLRFHRYDGRDRIEQRKKLAEELGKTVNALRIEAFRRRKNFRACLDRCLDGEKFSGPFGAKP